MQIIERFVFILIFGPFQYWLTVIATISAPVCNITLALPLFVNQWLIPHKYQQMPLKWIFEFFQSQCIVNKCYSLLLKGSILCWRCYMLCQSNIPLFVKCPDWFVILIRNMGATIICKGLTRTKVLRMSFLSNFEGMQLTQHARLFQTAFCFCSSEVIF